ncbi:MAG: hypothetical protein M1829_003219 [Trizodia sp. TS-e1964]|nr:MAG: hypothetical protein M1829_003219 [Trizodia sp. TS-e1964]
MNTTTIKPDASAPLSLLAAASIEQIISHWKGSLVLLCIAYPILVKLLRFRRVEAMHKKFNYPTRQSLSRMTIDDAQAIQSYLAQLEFPKIFQTSLQFALFRTYGFPDMSKLLVETGQLSKEGNSSKRYADTEVLIGEFMSNKWTDARTTTAIARMNCLHSLYQNAGKISPDDMLYTLSVFVSQPIKWINDYEWRPLTDMEVCAIGTFWKSIGDAMGISYENLPSFGKWKDGIHWAEEITAWSLEYEEKYMVPMQSNETVAGQTMGLLLWFLPRSLRPTGQSALSALMDKRLRAAMGSYADPPAFFQVLMPVVMHTRQFLLRHLWLPRPTFLGVHKIGPADASTGCFYAQSYLKHPYYVQPTLLSRWGLESWLTRAMGGVVPGDQGAVYAPGGYRIAEVGPPRLEGKGMEQVAEWERKLERERLGGGMCPFVGVAAS